MNLPRSSGILLHPTSLPGPFGVGDLGCEALRFVDFLAETGQSYWQVLPLGPTGYGNSPYMGFSAFAGNPMLISPEGLAEAGLLEDEDLAARPGFPEDHVAYPQVIGFKFALLQKAFQRFQQRAATAYPDDFYQFSEQNAFWLEDYALFMALKEAHDGRVWTNWESGAAARDPAALVRWRNDLRGSVLFHKLLQYAFFRQWQSLKDYAAQRGIRLIGDMPIYVAHDSADVWAHRDLFHLDAQGNPIVVAGVPPDYFSATGQRWGNPIYRWDVMAQDGFSWWIHRFRFNYCLVDLVRLDHFRGFEAYWEIPADQETAAIGRWVKGLAEGFFERLREGLGRLDVIAEDLGVITPEVDALRDRFGLPGMRILQMAFGTDAKSSEYLPHNYVHHCVVYTATHDHNTTVGWFTAEPGTQSTQSREEIERERRRALEYLGSDGRAIHWDFIRLALGSVANLAMFPLQDVLGLGTESRMNLPGTVRGNWEWRFSSDMLTAETRGRLQSLTRLYERQPKGGAPPRRPVSLQHAVA